MCNVASWRPGLIGWTVLASAALSHAGESAVSLVPPPKEVAFPATPAIVLPDGSVAIVIGDRASEPERYAAELLQKNVAKRFGPEWPVIAESGDHQKYRTIILLGQRSTHGLLERLCAQKKLRLSPQSPGHDGYVIQMFDHQGRQIVLVGGSNPRGVIYGQDTLFQLLGQEGGRTTLTRASVRDWPTVPWRGRARTHYLDYLKPGEFDCYLTARVNWIDLRTGTYAFGPGEKLDKKNIGEVIQQAHRRGLRVYATVNCGVPREEYDDVLETFDEMVQLGADGLWISFDDKGPGDAPEEIVTRILAYGRSRGITGDRITICPPKGSYQEIVTEFNRRIMAIPGMEQAWWWWTRVPSGENLAAARSIGIKSKPAWWHNWLRPEGGFTHISHRTMHKEDKRSYLEVPTLSPGWHAPSYPVLATAGPHVDSILPWGGMKLAQYYIVPVLDWWGWDPANHDFPAARRRIYTIVFGAGQVEPMMTFDDTLARVKSLFAYPWKQTEWFPACPARLKQLTDRDRALAMIAKLEELLSRIAPGALRQSMLPTEELRHDFLEAMRDELVAGRAAALASYPEYWWNDHQRKLLTAVYDGNLPQADELIAEVRDRLLGDLAEISQGLGHLNGVNEYVDWWTERAGMQAEGWRRLVAERRVELADRIWKYGYYVAVTSNMVEGMRHPLLGWGTGRWERANRVLATVLPSEREAFWGDWIGGLYRKGDTEAAVFACHRRTHSRPGTFSELQVELPLAGKRDRLALLIFLSNVNKDEIGLDHVEARWADHRFITLTWDDKTLWEADLGRPREQGEWFMVKLPAMPEDLSELSLRLRVEDRRIVLGPGIVFVGPIRLIELPE